MSTGTKIEWTEATWNPISGCTKVSPGCDNCYAERIVNRFKGKGAFDTVIRDEKKLFLPLKWRRPRRVFVNSMSDLFHEAIPDEFIVKVFAVMGLAAAHTFQVLTKRHARMRSLLRSDAFREAVELNCMQQTGHEMLPAFWPLRNVWLGVSVEDQKWADIRIPVLLDTPAAVRWLSCEPLLGRIDLSPWMKSVDWPQCWDKHSPINECSRCIRPDWVVVGGESGPGARPMHPEWARVLRDQCFAAEVPFFFKQWGAWQNGSRIPSIQRGTDHVVLCDGRHVEWSAFPDSDLAKGSPEQRHGACVMSRVGKKAAGRELDGRTWDEYPAGGA